MNLLPINETISVVRGTTRRWQAVFLDLSQAGTPPLDITGATVRLTVKANFASASPVIYTVDAVITDAVNGLVTFTIPKTADFGADGEVTTFEYEILLITAGAEEFVWWTGDFIVAPRLT
jgi:hypothetical protein